MLGFDATSPRVWPVTPDWASGVQEVLSWKTDILQAPATGSTQHRSIRTGPRRRFRFSVAAARQERRVVEMLLAGHSGAWRLPIWPDVQWLTSTVAAGTDQILVPTAGYDFRAGGQALLYAAVNRWELVDVESVAPGYLALSGPTTAAFGPGARLYPVRRAYVQDGAEERLGSDDFGRRSIVFDIAEPCDWPSLAAPALYLGHLVLGVRPDESDDPTSSYARLLQTFDIGTGLPVVYDFAGLGFRAQQSHWKLAGRPEHTWFRSLLYTLDGRRVPIWVPSWASDLAPVAAISGGSPVLTVEWAGYTQFGLDKHNRKDVRIELRDGTTFHRRITAAIEAGDAEVLTLDSALGDTTIAPEHIRQISFMALSTLASDEVEIEHLTDADGVATATTGWKAVVPDV